MTSNKIILFLLLLFILPNSIKANDLLLKNKINTGIVDLNNFNFNTPFTLSGKWKFINEDDYNFSLPLYDDSHWKTIEVPGFWNKTINNGHGIGWLRLTIHLDNRSDLGLYIESALSAYEIYINGKKIMHRGVVGDEKQKSYPQVFKSLSQIPDNYNGQIIIAWRISNFDSHNGGPESAPIIGIYKDMNLKIQRINIKNAVLIGIILMMFFYNFILFLGRKKEKSLIFFSLFSFVLSIRLFFLEELFDSIFPYLSPYIFELRYRIDFISAPLLIILLVYFFYHFIQIRKSFQRILVKSILYFNIVLIIISLFTSVNFFTRIAQIYNISLIIEGLILLSFIIFAIIEKKKFATLILTGALVLFITLVNDILYAQRIIYSTFLLYYGFIFFLITQTTALSLFYSSALSSLEYLSNNLKNEVKTRTNQIKNIMQQRTQFFVNIAHETKTPLTLIDNYLTAFIKNKGTSEEISIIKHSIEKLKNDIVNFMDTEKMERNQEVYDHGQTCNLSELLLQKNLLFKETAKQKQIDYKWNIQEKAYINADPVAIDRILNNLLDNAVKYTNPGGSIFIELKKQEDSIKLNISDTGIGISEEQQENIFNAYYQLYHKKRNSQGLGMGLHIVKQIINSLSAKIVVDSTPGKGSKFTMTFKAVQELPDKMQDNLKFLSPMVAPPINLKDLALKDHDEQNKTIFLVEDNLHLVVLLKNELEPIYNFNFAVNGKSALQKLAEIPKPDIIISDIMMDEMDGYQFREAILKDSKLKGIPFLFLTAKTGKLEKEKGWKYGVVDYVCKPFQIEDLKGKINNLLILIATNKSGIELKESHKC